jgi:hypothetical protein
MRQSWLGMKVSSNPADSVRLRLTFRLPKATKIFQAVKTRSKEALEASRKKIEEVDEALRLEYNGIEEKRLGYDSHFKTAQEAGRTPPSDEGVELRDAETLRGDLETQQHNLDLHLNTNPGVIEQYENRQRQVSLYATTIYLLPTNPCSRLPPCPRRLTVARKNAPDWRVRSRWRR